MADHDPTLSPRIISARILRSHDLDLYCDVQQFYGTMVQIDRILAHIEWLGFELPQRVAISIARRLYVAMRTKSTNGSNGSSRPPNGKPDEEFCPDCGERVPAGEPCGCFK